MDMVISRWSVIVDNFDLKDAFLGPDETDSPSVVDPDAVLATSTALQRLQPAPGLRTQGIERCCAVELLKFFVLRPLQSWQIAQRDCLQKAGPSPDSGTFGS